MNTHAFFEQAQRLKLWTQTALDFWARIGADPRGGFAEQLMMDGSPEFDHLRRVRVQFRTAYVYAHAGALGWYDGAQDACDHAWEFATNAGCAGGDFITNGPKGCAHLVTGDGRLDDAMRDSYAQAFVILSGAWRYRAFGDKAALARAIQTLDFLDAHLKADNGGWYEALPLPKDSSRRQNPHMHLFEACLALYEACGDERALSQAHALYALFCERFYDSKHKAVLEFFNADWTPKDRNGGPAEPGHMMEWCWLLREYERLSGVDVSLYADGLYEGGMAYGFNEKLGFLCNAVNLDGTAANSNLRSWPQTELVKASVAQVFVGQTDKLSRVTDTLAALFDTYLNVPVKGGWADELSPDGTVISTVMPTSTFYHLFCMAAEVDRLYSHLSA